MQRLFAILMLVFPIGFLLFMFANGPTDTERYQAEIISLQNELGRTNDALSRANQEIARGDAESTQALINAVVSANSSTTLIAILVIVGLFALVFALINRGNMAPQAGVMPPRIDSGHDGYIEVVETKRRVLTGHTGADQYRGRTIRQLSMESN